jgi:dTDP-glucose pyrophosphorylase
LNLEILERSHILENKWKRAILPADSTIQQTIRNLDEVALKIVLVVNRAGELLGTISDGDIRRGLMRGLDLSSSIESIIHRGALVVPPEMSREAVVQLMLLNKIQQLPVIDTSHRVIGLHLWDEISAPTSRNNIVVVMAGGLGTRLRPYTENCPKPLLLVSGKPILEHIILHARAEGFCHFVLAVNYLAKMIEDYFGNGESLKVRIDYIRESVPMGTAGALALLDPVPEKPFIVTNGDLITDVRYGELLDFHTRYNAAATMAVRMHEWQHPFGVVQTDGVEIVGFEEKPIARSHINAGVYALEPASLMQLNPSSHCDMPTLFERLKAGGQRTIAYPMHEPWLDIGRPDDLGKVSNFSVKQ